MSENTALSSPNHRLMSRLLAAIGNAPVQIVLWDGTRGYPPGSNPAGTVFIKSPGTLLKLAIDPELYFGEEFSGGRIEIKGDLLRILMEVFRSISRARPRGFSPLGHFTLAGLEADQHAERLAREHPSAITTSAMTSINSGWMNNWSTPALTSRARPALWKQRRSPRCTTFAGNSDCGPAIEWLKPDAAGAPLRSTWPAITAQP